MFWPLPKVSTAFCGEAFYERIEPPPEQQHQDSNRHFWGGKLFVEAVPTRGPAAFDKDFRQARSKWSGDTEKLLVQESRGQCIRSLKAESKWSVDTEKLLGSRVESKWSIDTERATKRTQFLRQLEDRDNV